MQSFGLYFLMGNRQKQQSTAATLNNISIDMLSRAIVGGGCFWCVEAVLQRLKGVHKVESGYAGGFLKNPSYESVCSGQTGHAEVCRIFYDPNTIDYQSTACLLSSPLYFPAYPRPNYPQSTGQRLRHTVSFNHSLREGQAGTV